MLNVGDLVVHPRYGAAVVEEMRTMKYQEKTKQYYCLRLARVESLVMIPEDALEQAGLRLKLLNAPTIKRIMHKQPSKLDEDSQERRTYIETQMQSDNPHEVVSALRDICWYEAENGLTQTEIKLRKGLFETIASELSAFQRVDSLTARADLKQIVDDAIAAHHITEHPDEAADGISAV